MPLKFETQLMRIPESILQAETRTSAYPQSSKLTSLPVELLLQILSHLSAFDRASLALTCHSFARFTTSFSLLTFTFHLPRHSFPDAPELLTYEDALTDFLLRLGRDWSKSSAINSSRKDGLRFCPSCAKFVPRSKDYWDDKSLKYMVRGGGVEGGKWRRACQHFGGTYPLEAWIEKWCNEEEEEDGMEVTMVNLKGGCAARSSKPCCPRCKVMASSG